MVFTWMLSVIKLNVISLQIYIFFEIITLKWSPSSEEVTPVIINTLKFLPVWITVSAKSTDI